MKDERITRNLKVIFQTNFYVLSFITVISTVVNTLIWQHSANNLIIRWDQYLATEIFLLVGAFITLAIVFIYRTKFEVIDERIQDHLLTIYQWGFWVLVIGGVSIHFIRILLWAIPPTPIASWAVTISIWLSFFLSRRRGLFLNSKIIDLSLKLFLFRITIRLLLGLVTTFILFIILLFIASLQQNELLAMMVTFSLFISYFSIGFQYLFLSIYEKIKFDHDEQKATGHYSLIHFFPIIVLIYMNIIGLITGFMSQILRELAITFQIFGFSLPIDVAQIIYSIGNLITTSFAYDQVVWNFAFSLMLYFSFMATSYAKPLLRKWYVGYLIVFLIFRIFIITFQFFSFILVSNRLIDLNQLATLSTTINIISNLFPFIDSLIILIYLWNRKIPVIKRYLFRIVLLVVYLVAFPYFVSESDINNIISISYLFSLTYQLTNFGINLSILITLYHLQVDSTLVSGDI